MKFIMNEKMIRTHEKEYERNSSLELLRILAMIMIVFHHFAVHGGFVYDYSVLTIPRFWVNFISMGGKIGVDVFVLISGYFLVVDREPVINVRRIFKFWFQIYFYSIIIVGIFGYFGLASIGMKHIAKAVCPVLSSSWWFASAYFVMYLLHGFIDKMLLSFDKKMYQCFLVILFVCWSIIPTFLPTNFQSNSLTWFIFLYSISGYIRLYGLRSTQKCKHYFFLWLAMMLVTYIGSCTMMLIGTKWSIFAKYSTHLFAQNSVTVLLMSILLFMMFLTLKIDYNKYINTVAASTFGVYLIHDSGFVRPFLWKTVFHNASYQDSLMVIPYSIAVVAVVYVSCIVIDLLRKYTIERYLLSRLGVFLDKSTVWVNDYIQGLGEKLLP